MKYFFRKLIPLILLYSMIQEIENKALPKKTFSDLQNQIDKLDGNQLNLIQEYEFDPKVDKPTGIIINKTLNLDGNAFHINGLNQSKIFQIINTEVYITAGVFINGFSDDFGGAITLINSTLHLYISRLAYNTANKKGGGIYLNNSFLNITDCIFENNYVKSNYLSGGGIYSENSRVRIYITHLRYNYADEGAAIYSLNSNVDIYNSLLYNNYANWYGGAIASDSHLFIKSSVIYNNRCGYKGGAIHTTYSYITQNCFVEINHTSFYNNSAEYGGVISSSNIKYVHINNSTIYDNKASFGAIISKQSVSEIKIYNSSCTNNIATKGGILYASAGGNNNFIVANIINNKADVGGIIYNINGRDLNEITNFNTNFTDSFLSNNYGKKGLIYSIYDDIIVKNTSITKSNKCYDVPIIYKIVGGKVIDDQSWWGEYKADLSKLIIYEYKNINNINKLNDKNLRSDGCSSTVIQADDNNCAFTFRRDSSKPVYVNIDYQNDGILQYKTDETFFWHAILNKDGWVFGNGGVDSPQSCEKLEAYSKIMAKKNTIIDEFIENAHQIKSMQTVGHYFIKSPNGTYVLLSYDKSSKKIKNETGKLKSGEYIICPNDYQFYRNGKISDLKIKGNNTYISRYLAAIDEYSSKRTNEFTYNYIKKDKSKAIDIFISNDDGSLSNKPNTSSYSNDVFIDEKYILRENVPIIMDGMYLGRYISQKNASLNLKMNIILLLFIWLLIL